MKIHKIIIILALPAISYSNTDLHFSNKLHFSNEIDTYQNVFEMNSFNIERTYNYECSTEQVSRSTNTSEIEHHVTVTIGKITEKVMDNGKTVEFEDSSIDGLFRSTYKYDFLDENTLISTADQTSTFFSEEEENTIKRKSKKITKLIDGKTKVISYTIDGEEQELKSPYNLVSIEFDPFRTKYVETITLIDFENARRSLTEILELQKSCIYTQNKISSYLDLIPEVAIGTWTEESSLWEETTSEKMPGDDIEAFIYDIATIVFNKNGTYKIKNTDNSTLMGMYKIENGVVKFKENGATKYIDMFKLSFKSFNEFSISIEMTDSTLSIGNFKRQKI